MEGVKLQLNGEYMFKTSQVVLLRFDLDSIKKIERYLVLEYTIQGLRDQKKMKGLYQKLKCYAK